MERLHEEGRTVYEYRFRRPGGDYVWLRDEMTLVRDEEGEPVEVVGVCRDVTEQRELEEQLRQSQKMEAVGRLAGGVAHDFNNLVTAITGYGELLLMEMGQDHPSRRDLEEILKAGERASSLTRQLLAFSRRQVLQPKVLDLNQVVSDVERMLRRVIGEDVDLVVEPTPGIRRVEADPGQIEQVLVNLAVNARDAMPRGGTLVVRTDEMPGDEVEVPDAEETPERWVRLRVRDTGDGIPKEVQDRVFEPFFTTKKQGEGTGLGLAMVYGIVQQSGGQIEVESGPGEGTEFTVFLPGVDKEVAPRESRDGLSLEARNGETVLVVEDEEGVRKLVRRTLESRGYEVLEASDGETARSVCLGDDCPDLVISDVVMPDMRGPELAAELEASGSELPFLFMSGYPGRERTGSLPEDARFLQKPFTAEDLLRQVQEALERETEET